MDQTAYLRHPAIHADTLTFVCDDDLWQVGSDGGVARRLTAGLSEPSTPSVSPDGKWLAFIGRDEQHPEVHVMPAEGGPARRLTWLGPDTQVRGWTPEGLILFVTTHGSRSSATTARSRSRRGRHAADAGLGPGPTTSPSARARHA